MSCIHLQGERDHIQVRMGFPQQNAEGPAGIVFVGADCLPKSGGYTCPRYVSETGLTWTKELERSMH